MTISLTAARAEHAVDTARRANDQLYPTLCLLQSEPDRSEPIRDAIDLIERARSALRTVGAR